MEEIEISVESQHETIQHHAEHSGEEWMLQAALISALLAVASAVCGLYSAHFANEAMLEQMESSDLWGYYQAKGIKANLAEMHTDLLEASNRNAPQALKEKLERYRQEQAEIKEKAEGEEKKSQHNMELHQLLAKAVTAFQVGIAITAITAITKRKHFLYVTLGLAIVGVYFVSLAIMQ